MIFIDFSFRRRLNRLMLSGVCAAALAGVLFLAGSPASASLVSDAGGYLLFPPERAAGRALSSPFAIASDGAAAWQRAQIAQSSADRFQTDRRSREISDQEHAKHRRDRGQNKSFDELLQRASSVGRGEYLGVEPDISSNIYRFKFMRTSGKVVWVDMDGQTGRVVAERE